MAGDALMVSVILATVIVLIIIALMVEGAYVGYELDEDAQNGCCCGVAGLCSSRNCGSPGS
jgi:hypothetical protein